MRLGLRIALILEAFLAYIYVSLTNGVFLAYLASLGYGAGDMSVVIMASSLPPVLIGYLFFKKPSLFLPTTKKKLLAVHAGERLVWLAIPLLPSFEGLAAIYLVKNLFSSLISLHMNNLIYGAFDEIGIRDVTSKRSSLASISSIIGYFLATVFLTAGMEGFIKAFVYGSLVGLASTLLMALPEIEVPFKRLAAIRAVEKVYSVSLYQVLYLASANLLSILWASIMVKGLGLEGYWVALVSLVGTVTTIFASLFWGKRGFRHYRYSLALDAATPFLVLVAGSPYAHLAASAYSSMFGTGSYFLGGFLYARYLGDMGPAVASSLLMALGGAGQLLGSLIGSVGKEDYAILAAAVVVFRLAALLVAFLAIPEVAVVPDHMARNYAGTLYDVSVLGYRVTVEISREAVMTTVRIAVLTACLAVLYVIYRAAMILLGV